MDKERFFQFLQHEKRFSRHTLEAYRRDIHQFETFLVRHDSHRSITQADTRVLRSWMAHLLQLGRTPTTVRRKMAALRTFFRFLQQQGVVDQNPVASLNLPKIGKRLPSVVRADAMAQLLDQLEVAEGFFLLRDRVLLELLYGLGLRRSELIDLRLPDLDLQQQQVRVRGKGSQERILPVGRPLAKLLEHYLEERSAQQPHPETDHLLLTNKGAPLYPKWVYNQVHRYLSAVSTLEQRSPHVLRHAFATHLSEAGADLNAIKTLLGHANLGATQVYTHNSIERLKKVYDQAHPKGRE